MTSQFLRGLAFSLVLMTIVGVVQNQLLTTTLPRTLTTTPSVKFALENINPLYYFIRTYYIYPDLRPSNPYASNNVGIDILTDLGCYKHCRADSRCRLSAVINRTCFFYDENVSIRRERGINSFALRTLDLSKSNFMRGYLLSSPFQRIPVNFTDQICYQICLLVPNCTAVTNVDNSCNLFNNSFSYERSASDGFYAVGPITFEPKVYPFVRLFESYNDNYAAIITDPNVCFQRCAAERQCIASMVYFSSCLFFDNNMVIRKELNLRAYVFKKFEFETTYPNIRFSGQYRNFSTSNDSECFRRCQEDEKCTGSQIQLSGTTSICNFFDVSSTTFSLRRESGVTAYAYIHALLRAKYTYKNIFLINPYNREIAVAGIGDAQCYSQCLLQPNCVAASNLDKCYLYNTSLTYNRTTEYTAWYVPAFNLRPVIWSGVRFNNPINSANIKIGLSYDDCFSECISNPACTASMINPPTGGCLLFSSTSYTYQRLAGFIVYAFPEIVLNNF